MEKKRRAKPVIVPASFSHRFVAALFDFCLSLLLMVVFLSPALVLFLLWIKEPTVSMTAALFVALFAGGAIWSLLELFYWILLPFLKHGETLGLAFMGLRIVDERGKEAPLRAYVLRAFIPLVLIILTLGLYYVVEMLSVLFSSKKTSFADVSSMSYVVERCEARR